MRFSILRDDNLVIVDGVAMTVDCSSLPANVHAVWFDEAKGKGEVEFVNEPGSFNAKMPERVHGRGPYQAFLNAWEAAKIRIEAEEAQRKKEMDEALAAGKA